MSCRGWIRTSRFRTIGVGRSDKSGWWTIHDNGGVKKDQMSSGLSTLFPDNSGAAKLALVGATAGSGGESYIKHIIRSKR